MESTVVECEPEIVQIDDLAGFLRTAFCIKYDDARYSRDKFCFVLTDEGKRAIGATFSFQLVPLEVTRVTSNGGELVCDLIIFDAYIRPETIGWGSLRTSVRISTHSERTISEQVYDILRKSILAGVPVQIEGRWSPSYGPNWIYAKWDNSYYLEHGDGVDLHFQLDKVNGTSISS